MILVQIKLDPVTRVNSCPRGFCCCVKVDSSYQLSKIAEIVWVNQQGALQKQLDPGLQTGILATEVLLPWQISQFWLQKTLVKFKGQDIMLFSNRAYTKHQHIHDQESFRKMGFFYSALQSPIQYSEVTASDTEISSLFNGNA